MASIKIWPIHDVKISTKRSTLVARVERALAGLPKVEINDHRTGDRSAFLPL